MHLYSQNNDEIPLIHESAGHIYRDATLTGGFLRVMPQRVYTFVKKNPSSLYHFLYNCGALEPVVWL